MSGLTLVGIVLQLGLSNPVTAPLVMGVAPLAVVSGGFGVRSVEARVQAAPPPAPMPVAAQAGN